MKELMKIGDKFVVFTKYGGTVIGEIARIDNNHRVMRKHGNKILVYYKPKIISTNNVSYLVNDIYILDQEIMNK